MKRVFILLVIVGAGIGGYFYMQPGTPAPAPAAPAAPAAQTIPPVAEAPAPSATPAPPPPDTAKHIAPPGVYFLTQTVSVTSDAGIDTLTAGTKVIVVKEKGKTWVVTDGQTQLPVPQEQLTNDLDVAAAITKASQSQDAAAAASVRAQQDIVRKAQQDQAAGVAKERQWEVDRATAAAAAAAATPTPSAPPDDEPARSSAGSSKGTPPPFGRPAGD